MCHPEICHLKCLENARTMMIRKGMFTSETRGLSEGVGSVRKVSAVQNLRAKNQAHRKMLSLNSYDGKLPPLLVQRDLQLTDPSFGA